MVPVHHVQALVAGRGQSEHLLGIFRIHAPIGAEVTITVGTEMLGSALRRLLREVSSHDADSQARGALYWPIVCRQ